MEAWQVCVGSGDSVSVVPVGCFGFGVREVCGVSVLWLVIQEEAPDSVRPRLRGWLLRSLRSQQDLRKARIGSRVSYRVPTEKKVRWKSLTLKTLLPRPTPKKVRSFSEHKWKEKNNFPEKIRSSPVFWMVRKIYFCQKFGLTRGLSLSEPSLDTIL